MSATAHNIEKPAPETVFGFWVYIMTDCMIFASLFAVFAVQRSTYAAGRMAICSICWYAAQSFSKEYLGA